MTAMSAREAAPRGIEPAEWDARIKLAACYRMVAKLGMDDLIYNHISLRVPGHDDQFLINP
ncbi:ribulose-5-phosphate 4-epimerase/fuculose-1-phosphate aldolase [Bradyrhizobium sp. i1.3.6]